MRSARCLLRTRLVPSTPVISVWPMTSIASLPLRRPASIRRARILLCGCGDVVFLAGFELGAPDGEEKHSRFERRSEAIEFELFAILQMRVVDGGDAGNPRSALFESGDERGRGDSFGAKLAIFFGERDAGGRMKECIGAFQHDGIVERVEGLQFEIGRFGVNTCARRADFPGLRRADRESPGRDIGRPREHRT